MRQGQPAALPAPHEGGPRRFRRADFMVRPTRASPRARGPCRQCQRKAEVPDHGVHLFPLERWIRPRRTLREYPQIRGPARSGSSVGMSVRLKSPGYPAGCIPAGGGQRMALGRGAYPCTEPPYAAAASVDCAALHRPDRAPRRLPLARRAFSTSSPCWPVYRTCVFSKLRGQRCSSGGCPATAADFHDTRKLQFARSIRV